MSRCCDKESPTSVAENQEGLFVAQATCLLQVSWEPELTGPVSIWKIMNCYDRSPWKFIAKLRHDT